MSELSPSAFLFWVLQRGKNTADLAPGWVLTCCTSFSPGNKPAPSSSPPPAWFLQTAFEWKDFWACYCRWKSGNLDVAFSLHGHSSWSWSEALPEWSAVRKHGCTEIKVQVLMIYFPEISLGFGGKNEKSSGLAEYSILTWQEWVFCLFVCFQQRDQRNKEHKF